MTSLRIGTAGWALPRAVASAFPAEGSGLQRYAGRFDAVEINTTFYRPHRPQTFERWAQATPPGFRFAVKLPRAITHEARLRDAGEPLAAFIAETSRLGDKLGPLLLQLPPSLAFEPEVAERFFMNLRGLSGHLTVCEPRHPSWFGPEAEALLREHRIGRVGADPAPDPLAGAPAGWPALAYWRLHGSPRMYFSPYGEDALRRLAQVIASSGAQQAWVIFDNTASGAAAADALTLQALMAGR